jgi:hypothetical protein
MLTAQRVLDEYYLDVRCKLLEIAAIFDRYERGGGDVARDDEQRLARCRQALSLLYEAQTRPDRAEQLSLIFSDPVASAPADQES